MADIESGLYYIIEASDPTKCIGVQGWSSNNDANVSQHNLNKTEGQTCFVSEVDDGYVIGFPLTGKVLCVADKGAGAGRWYVGNAFMQSSDDNTDEWVQNTTGIEYAYVGDVYLNQARLTTFRCTFAGDINHAKWTYTGNVASAVGNPAPGTRWHSGTVINSVYGGKYKNSEVSEARVGDMYLNYNNGFVFRCTTAGAPNIAVWEFVTDIQPARTRTDDNTNVYQHDWDGTKAEAWSIEETENTVVVDGETLSTYFISTLLDETKVLAINSSGNAVIYSRTNTSVIKEFAFIPIDTVPEGTYRIIPQTNRDTCIAIQSNSDAIGAWCIHSALKSDNASCNYQIWKVDHLSSGKCSVRNAGNGHALGVKASNNLYYAAALAWDGSDAEAWVTRNLGEAEYNGSNTPTYHVAVTEGNKNLVLDSYGMQNSSTRAKSLNKWAPLTEGGQSLSQQRYMFIPAEGYSASGVTVPSDLALYANGKIDTLIGANDAAYVYPCWRGSGEEWQVRWCYSYRAVGSTKYCADDIPGHVKDWSPYYALGDGSKANNGWGEPGQPNCSATYVDGWYIADQPIILPNLGIENGKYDGYHIYFEVRQVVHNYGVLGIDAHGGAASGYMWVCWQPTITFSNAALSLDGIELDYVMQPVRGKNNIKITSKYFDISVTGVKSSGTLTTSKLKAIPDMRHMSFEATIEWEITSANDLTSTGSTIITVSNDLGQAPGLAGVIEAWSDETKVLRVMVPQRVTELRAWMQIDGENEIIECPSEDNNIYVYYPFNKPFMVVVFALINNRIRVWTCTYEAQACTTRVWNWDGSYPMTSQCFELAYGLGNSPQESIKTAPTAQSRNTTMRKWGLTQLSNSYNQDRNINGVLIDALYENAFNVLNEFAQCGFSWYRNPEGEVTRVAVTSVTSNEIKEGIHQITVQNKRVDS